MQKVLVTIAITLIILLSGEGNCQNSTDHFRSKASGTWELPSNWESSPDSIEWHTATVYPNNQSKSITVQPHDSIVILNSNYSFDQLTVSDGAILGIRGNVTITNGEGDDLKVFGKIRLLGILTKELASTIVIKEGGKYLADINSNKIIYPCTWESGSMLELENFGTQNTVEGLSQSLSNLTWKGSTQSTDISLNLTNEFGVNNNFIVESTNGHDLILTGANTPITFYINGNLELKNKSCMILSSGIVPITLTIGGNLNIGTDYAVLARLGLGSITNTGNILNLTGDLNINTQGGINHYSNTLNGTLCFINNSNVQHIESNGVIKKLNYILNPGVKVSSSSWSVNDGYTLKLKNNASLITSSSPLQASIERTVTNADWNVAKDGWHLISSPVSGQQISGGGFTWPFGDPLYDSYDFYAWSEPQNEWLNQKVSENGITTFVPGTGYLVAYDEGGIKTFTGILNNTSIPLTNLSYTETSGYHLLGNPFPCALDWNHNSWHRNNVSNVAHIWNETAENYLGVTTTVNRFIPSNQGFFVQVSSITNSLVIPVEAKVHNNQTFNKHSHPETETTHVIYFRVTAIGDSTYDETIIRLHDEALPEYDLNDGHKLTGSDRAPQLYSEITLGEYASVNSFPISDPPETVPLFFRPGFSDSYELELLMNSMEENVFLEDLLTGQITPLNEETFITFSASPQDVLRRFLLHLGPVGLPEVNAQPFSLYSYGRNIYIRSTAAFLDAGEPLDFKVMSITGCIIKQGQISVPDSGGAPTIINLPSAPPGIYLISLTSSSFGCLSKKMIIF